MLLVDKLIIRKYENCFCYLYIAIIQCFQGVDENELSLS